MSYNSWSSYETWNVVLWLQNDESIWIEFRAACRPFIRAGMLKDDLVYCAKMAFIRTYDHPITPDGISLNSPEINWREIFDAACEWFDIDNDVRDETVYEEWERKDSFGKEIY